MDTITISKEKYNELKEKAKAFEKLVDNEKLSKADLNKIIRAKKTRLLTEKEFFGSD